MDDQLTSGPYRATLLWNGLIRNFRSDIPLGRHRRYMKTYDDCFVASDAVDWLHQYLKKNPNFGTDVSRAQSVQLLQKLHKAKVFEDVRGQKHNRGEFTDSSRLFRLTLSSPSKAVRTPIALRNNLKLANLRRSPLTKPMAPPNPVKLDFDRMSSMPTIPDNTSTLPECHFMSKPLSAQEIEEEWKNMTLQNLQKILGVDALGDIIDAEYVKGKFIMHNCLYINKSGVVTNIDPKDQLPHWALSAMKCLAYWPDKIDENLPNYPGFEKDVFRVVKEYFCELPEPLMTYNMYEVITNVFVTSSNLNQKKGHVSRGILPSNCEYSNSTPKLINAYKSVENLLMKLTRNSKTSAECQDASEGYSSGNILDLSPIQPVHNSSRTSKQGDPVTRYETAFGPDNKTVTRVFYADGVATDFNHIDNGKTNIEHTPIETHFEDSPPSSESAPSFSRKNGLRHSMHNLFNRGKRAKAEKASSRRRSAGYNLNEVDNYGCTVGVYSRTSPNNSSHDTPVSRLASVSRSESCAAGMVEKANRKFVNGKPPAYAMPPSYDALYPESLYPKSSHPTSDKSRKFLKRKKSISTASLNHRKSFIENSDSGKGNSSSLSDKSNGGRNCDNDVVVGRSLSMSDLAAATPPVENELQKQCMGKIQDSEDSVFLDDSTERIIKALQLVCLILPPANRRRLHLLLRLMNKMSTNNKLVLDETQPSRTLLLETFYRAVLCCSDESEMDDLLVIQLVSFLMDHYMEIFSVPDDLKTSVELRVTKLQRTKVKAVCIDCGAQIRYSSDDSASLHFCKQLSMDEYENQRMTSSQQALASLLEDIVSDKSMALKEKKKRLKQFQKTYPDIYLRRFPCSQSEAELFPPRPKIKQPLLAKPLLKLKGLRL
ncbi:DEP domain-containing protein 1B-like isoform X2 [Ruditapes philippinarum]|uniref:DEP domain-containing protein 1B-like isoform X2 n=1 Tax=Ruditapes philippinarum TaxID=129788 RepID=UPI00295BF764|nr:DEP domain-containing protein 1B-like isoform X2 [Ruditapes philippinarum]